MTNLSIVIPCYNESKSLSRLLEACLNACKSRNDIEFVFVNNGSNDDTQIILNQLLSLVVIIKLIKRHCISSLNMLKIK